MGGKRKKQKNDLSSVNLSANGSLLSNSKNELNVESFDLSDILNKKWKVFRVSPFYNFNSSKLILYEKKLNDELNAKKGFGSNVVYHSSFTLNNKLRLDDNSVEALQVEVTNNQSKNVYLGYFISWSDTTQNLQNFISLPILLTESKSHETLKVHSSICKMFDCDIQPVTFSLHALITFLVKLLETPKQNSNNTQEGLTLEYKIPGCEVKDSIRVTLILEDTIIVFAVIIDNLREKISGITNSEIIFEFYIRILNHIYNVHKMDLLMAELNKISFPDAFITADGQLKVSTNNAAVSALTVLKHFTPLDPE